jgi:hypothetical protein
VKALALALVAAALLLAGCGSSGPRPYSVADVKAAFASQGFKLSEAHGRPTTKSRAVWLGDRDYFIQVAVFPEEVKNPVVRPELAKGNVEAMEARPIFLLRVIKALQHLP